MSSVIRRRDLASPLSEFLSTLVMVVIIWYGGNLIFESQADGNNFTISPQTFIGFIIYFSQILPPVNLYHKAIIAYKEGLHPQNGLCRY